jgi:hypothetical protein
MEIIVNFVCVMPETCHLPLGYPMGVHISARESENADVCVGKSLFEPLFEEPKRWEVSKIGFNGSRMRGELVCPVIVTSGGPLVSAMLNRRFRLLGTCLLELSSGKNGCLFDFCHGCFC